MRPQRLEMKGFGAFRERTEVDFSGVDLMALVGPTGSGKSTVIDAIAFALYGSIVRYDDGRKVAPVVNQLATEARVRLDFELGGDVYTAVRLVRRTKTGATTREARLERDAEVLADGPKELTETVTALLGLDFDRFVKTVVLPQGRFAGFLHDTPTHRQELLRELLGLGMYERMGRTARERAKRAGNQIAVLEPQLERWTALDDASFASLIAEAGAAEAATSVLGGLMIEIDAAAKRSAAARADLEGLRELQIAVAEVAVPDGVAALGEIVDGARQAADRAADELRLAVEQRETADAAVETGPDRSRLQDLLELHARADALADEIEVLTGQAESARNDAGATTQAVVALDDRIEELRTAIDALRTEAERAEAARAAGPDSARIASWRQSRTEREELAAQVAASAAAVDVAARDLAATATDHEHAADAAARAEADLDAVRRSAGAAALLAGVGVGDDCPVCHRALDDLPAHAAHADLAEAEATRARTRRAAEAARAALDVAAREHAAVDGRQRSLTGRLDALDRLLIEIPTVGELDRLDDEVATLAAEATAATAQWRAAQTGLDEVERSADTRSIREAARTCEARLVEVTSRLDVKRADRSAVLGRLAGAADRLSLEAEREVADDLVARQRRAVEGERAARALAAAARLRLDEVLAEERAERSLFDATRDRLAALGPPPAAFESLAADWQRLAAWAATELVELSRRFDDVEAAVATAESERSVIVEKAIQVVIPHVEADVSLDVDPGRLPVILAQAAERRRHDVVRAEADRERHVALTDQIEGLRTDHSVASELGRLLDPRAFERWLMEEIVDDLVERATRRLLVLTGGRYGLRRGDGDAFEVVDHHNAAEARDVKTLSGGETFLASLSLALGLADALTELGDASAPALESIFLDEGFGTLDAETLDVVAAAIEELGATGRMVGIVTHIRDLAERMPVRFEVQRGPETSRVDRVEV